MIIIENVLEILDFLKKEQKRHRDNCDFVHEDALLQGYEMAIEDIEKNYVKDVEKMK